jgi:hypothetical protein
MEIDMFSRTITRGSRALALTSISLVFIVATSPGRVQATAAAPGQTERDLLITRLEAGVESLGGLDPAQRTRMLGNLHSFLDAGLEPNRLVGLFPASEQPCLPGPEALRAQRVVENALAAGLPTDLILTKVQEGCRKHVAPGRVADAADRMGASLRIAADFLQTAARNGVADSFVPPHGWVGNVALNVWGGLADHDLAKLHKKAVERVRSGGCTVEELVAASDCAAGLLTAGAAHDQAVDIAGEALGSGMTPTEMREMSALVAAAQLKAPVDDVLLAVRGRLGNGVGTREIAEHLLQAGWLGPADVPGVGQAGPNAGPGSPGYPGGAGSDTRPTPNGAGSGGTDGSH